MPVVSRARLEAGARRPGGTGRGVEPHEAGKGAIEADVRFMSDVAAPRERENCHDLTMRRPMPRETES